MVEMPATLVDVAAAAGVSIATASRAINARPHVNPETRERVLDAARRLGFQPSQAARTLRTRRANVIGLIVPDISSVFYANALRAAEHTLRRQGYTLFISDTEEDSDLEWDAVNALLLHRVAGLILAPTGTMAASLRRVLAQHRVPIVVVDNRVDGLNVDAVLLDNVAGARALTAHLIGHGHRRIAHLGGLIHETSGAERLAGYRQALEAAGLPFDALLAPHGDWTEEAGRGMMAALLALPQPPTAVVVASHTMVIGALQALRAVGRRVPQDMALASFDDTATWQVVEPAITALERRDEDIGTLAAKLLLDRLSAPGLEGGYEIRLPMRLIVRGSCGCH